MKYASHLKKSAQMTDEERNLIDMECEKIFSVCFQLINDLKSKKKEVKVLKQESEHFDGILELLTNYIKHVQSIFNQQKKFRAQQDVETYKLLKLESDKKLTVIIPSSKVEETATSTVKHPNLNVHLDEDQVSKPLEPEEKSELSPEDIQMFESENVQLFNELKGLSEELEQIERNVVDIANLQSVFTEKVTLQKNDIDRIANTVFGATENVKDANEQIKSAIQRNAGLRVWILFFLLVMSFSLLFLDWYND